MKKPPILILMIIFLSTCTSIIEGTWTAENGDQIITKQSTSDPNLGAWEYLSNGKQLYQGDYVIDGYGEEIGFKNNSGNPAVFMGKLKDGSLFFQKLDGTGSLAEIEFTKN